MIILFAPSEGKRIGGEVLAGRVDSLLFSDVSSKRKEIVELYEEKVRNGSYEELSELFGIKNAQEFEQYKIPFASAPMMKAIERYDGVAYEYLDYGTLSTASQEYIDSNVIVFSNLFGPIRASDSIPNYKLKQGSMIGDVAPERFYKEHYAHAIDMLIAEHEVLDLRAGFYDKFYTMPTPALTLKFLKDGKVVSHWAKAYRGIALRSAAQHQVKSIDEFLALNIDGLILEEIIKTNKKHEVVYRIV